MRFIHSFNEEVFLPFSYLMILLPNLTLWQSTYYIRRPRLSVLAESACNASLASYAVIFQSYHDGETAALEGLALPAPPHT